MLGQVAVTKAMMPLIRAACGRIVFMGSASGRIATMMFAATLRGTAAGKRRPAAWSEPIRPA